MEAEDGQRPIPVVDHYISDKEVAAVVRVLRSRSLTTGPEAAAFEMELSAFFGTTEVLVCSSCTAALHLAMLAAGIGPGDEVITSPLTFPATVNAILLVGATPVLADVDDMTLSIHPGSVAEVITSKTKAILPVHLGGVPADLEGLVSWAEDHGVSVVADCAHAINSTLRGKHVAQFGAASCFSFYATKNLTTIEGGALTGSPELVQRARLLSRHGLEFAWDSRTPSVATQYEPRVAGLKYNMTDVQAAIGRVQLARLPDLQRGREMTVAIYRERLGGHRRVKLPSEPPRGDSYSWYLYQIRVPQGQRDSVRARLDEAGVGTGVYYKPLHRYEFYSGRARWKSLEVAEAAYGELLALPIHARMTETDAGRVADLVLEALDKP